MRIAYRQLIDNQHSIDLLRLHAIDMGLYLVEVELGGERLWVSGSGDRPMHFKSIEHAKQCFAACSVTRAELVHASPYDEMVGNPEASGQPLIVPLNFSVSSFS